MRIVIHTYVDGTRYAFETTLEGVPVRDVEGIRKPGTRIRAAIEVECEDNDEGRKAALADLDLARRQLDPAA
ncbi:MAG: hypothetical protein HY791_29110 [Deltaproteobacteria bacterium]|nr:hypothetical protein [Deltaproteobacteria bacterium]